MPTTLLRRFASSSRRGTLAVLLVVTLAAGCTGVGPAPSPSLSAAVDVYDVPDPLPYGAPGALVEVAPLTVTEQARGWRILYHSRDPLGGDIAVSGTVFVPPGPAPADGWPLVAWAHGTTGLGDGCAPSKASDPLDLIPGAAGLLDRGYAIVATDYAGIGTPGVHPYLIGPSESAAVLDSVRAAQAFGPAGIGEPVIVTGFSQGGHAAAFVAQSAATYAPEIDLRGVVAVSPPTDLSQLAEHFDGLPEGPAYLLMMAAGYSAVDAAADLDTLLTPAGQRAATLLESACVGELVPAVQGKKVAAIFAENPRLTSPWQQAFKLNSVGTPAEGLPILVLQGSKDPLVPAAETSRTVRAWCEKKVQVDYRTYAGLGHEFDEREQQLAQDWIAAGFARRSAQTSC